MIRDSTMYIIWDKTSLRIAILFVVKNNKYAKSIYILRNRLHHHYHLLFSHVLKYYYCCCCCCCFCFCCCLQSIAKFPPTTYSWRRMWCTLFLISFSNFQIQLFNRKCNTCGCGVWSRVCFVGFFVSSQQMVLFLPVCEQYPWVLFWDPLERKCTRDFDAYFIITGVLKIMWTVCDIRCPNLCILISLFLNLPNLSSSFIDIYFCLKARSLSLSLCLSLCLSLSPPDCCQFSLYVMFLLFHTLLLILH